MRAVRSHTPEGFEGIEGLVYEDAPDPQPAIGDALVQVRAASFTPTELMWPLSTDRAGHDRGRGSRPTRGRASWSRSATAPPACRSGDEVYGLIDGYRDGWAAEYVAIEVRSLAPKPTTVDFVEAAAIPQAGLTSWQALFDHGHLESGQTVVIHGAGGGVGSMGGAAGPLGRRPRHRNRPGRALASACSTSAPTNSSTSSRTAGRRPSARSTWSTTPSAATCSPVRRPSSSPVAPWCPSWRPPQTDRRRHPHRSLRPRRRTVPSSARSLASSTRASLRPAGRRGLPAGGRTRGVHGQVDPAHSGQGRADDLTT